MACARVQNEEEERNTARLWKGGFHRTQSGEVNRDRFPLWPHASDLHSYEQELARIEPCATVLILGATPGLRDIAARRGAKAIVADINSAAMVTTSGFLSDADPNQETWIHDDWLSMHVPDAVDAVMGDIVWWLFSLEKQGILRDKIASVLRPGGAFISRFYLRKDMEKADLQHVLTACVEKARRNPAQRAEIYHSAFLALAGVLSGTDACEIDNEKTADFLLSAVENLPSGPADYLRRKAMFWRERGPVLTLQRKEEIMHMLGERFEFREALYVDDYEGSSSLPVLSWVRA